MHNEVLTFIQRVKDGKPKFFHEGDVLEIGSLDINGSARVFFGPAVEYTGVDPRGGPGVDVPTDAISFFKDNGKKKYDVAISTETFEHSKEWQKILSGMFGVVRKGGLVIVTAATEGREPHGWDGNELKKGDYYSNISPAKLETIGMDHKLLIWECDILRGDVRACWLV